MLPRVLVRQGEEAMKKSRFHRRADPVCSEARRCRPAGRRCVSADGHQRGDLLRPEEAVREHGAARGPGAQAAAGRRAMDTRLFSAQCSSIVPAGQSQARHLVLPIRRRGEFGASKPKTGAEFSRGRPNRTAPPSPGTPNRTPAIPTELFLNRAPNETPGAPVFGEHRVGLTADQPSAPVDACLP